VLEALSYAEADAERIATVLVELGGFDEELVTVLYRPSQEDLRRALAEHAKVADTFDEDLFLFYYSGHADGAGLRLGDDRYFFETLKHDLRVIGSDVRLGILDSCRSGTITRLKGAQITEPLFGLGGTAIEGEAWLTASAPDELAQESERLRGGFFTHYLLSGMRGAADTGDLVIDLQELYQYTSERVVEITGRTGAGAQHPHFDYQLSGAGEIGLTDVRNATAALVLREGDAGQIAVYRLPDKAQLAEFYKRSDRSMVIAVPAGRYLVRRRFEDATYEAIFGLNDGGEANLTEWGTPVIEFGLARGGDPRITELISESITYERRNGLGSSPVVAGGASLVIPGAGQLYNGQLWKGVGYFAVTSSLLAGVILAPGKEELGPGFWPALGAAAWGASIADATYNVSRNESHRPSLGGTVSFSGAFGGRQWPSHFGLSGDLMLRSGVSIGVDRLGITPGPEGAWDAHAGSRVMLVTEGERFRPHALVALGVRHGRGPFDNDALVTRAVFGAGAGLRYYVVPRYFAEVEGRWENDGLWKGITSAVGLGVHLGR